MGGLQSFPDPLADGQQVFCRHWPVLHLAIQTGTIDVIHQEVDQAIGGAVVLGIAHDGVMPDLPDFLLAGHQHEVILVAGKLRLQHLDRDEPARNLAPGPVHVRGAAPPQQGLDPVGIVQDVAGLKRVAGAGICHECIPINLAVLMVSDQPRAWNSTRRFASLRGSFGSKGALSPIPIASSRFSSIPQLDTRCRFTSSARSSDRFWL